MVLLSPQNIKKYWTEKIAVIIRVFFKYFFSILRESDLTASHKRVTAAVEKRKAATVNSPKPSNEILAATVLAPNKIQNTTAKIMSGRDISVFVFKVQVPESKRMDPSG